MVIGLGIDIIEIERIKKSVEKYGERFLSKIYTKNEIEYCLSKSNKYQHLAARFAAKEAIFKALMSGWQKGVSWQDMEIINETSGMPKANLSDKVKTFLSNDKELKISMSHSNNYVTCVAIIYQKK
ncbi:holo-[acyl-carrier-protein] synthase [bacterium BMS3Abin03]|nr:holo-[acyl-carrier-protein] synthase [bacterium BMS3Abin03]